jgi:N-methylhydantoinase A
MRYKGQAHELNIAIDLKQRHSPLSDLFHTAHQSRYGYQQVAEVVEIVTIRLTAVAPHTPPPLPQHPATQHDVATAVIAEKLVWFQQSPHRSPLYDRAKLGTGHQFHGPAIVTQYDTTIVIPPGWVTAVDSFHNLIVTRNNNSA